MIWVKICMAAILSGSLFELVETVLPPRPPEMFIIQMSDWPGDQVFALIDLLGTGGKRAFRLDVRRSAPGHDPVDGFRAGLSDGVLIDLARLPELTANMTTDEVRVIYAYDEVVSGGGLVVGAGIYNAGELRGRTIGLPFGASARSLALVLLGRVGLTLKDVSLLDMSPENAPDMLRSGRVAAVVLLAPSQVESVRQTVGGTVLASTTDSLEVPTHVLVVREGRIPEQRIALLALLRALDSVARTCRDAKSRCLDLVAKASGRPAVDWAGEFAVLRLLDLADNQKLLATGSESPIARRLAVMQTLSGVGRGNGPSAMEWLESSLVREASQP